MNDVGVMEGLLHAHTSLGHAAASDYAGLLVIAAGAVLAALAIPYLHLREEGARHPRRWAYRAATLVAGALVVYALVSPVTKIIGTHDHRKPIDEPRSSVVEQPFPQPHAQVRPLPEVRPLA